MPTTDSPRKNLVKAKPLARILDCGVSTVYALAKAGKIPSITIGVAETGVRFDVDAVLAALKRKQG
jgi:excisionase family DNA binding protein